MDRAIISLIFITRKTSFFLGSEKWCFYTHLVFLTSEAPTIYTEMQKIIKSFVSWRRFFYNDKGQNSKRYSFANVKSFWHLMWKTFCHSGGANCIKTNLQTCNLWTSQYVSHKSVNQFWFNLPHKNVKTDFASNVKNFSHLQIVDIFCYFDFFYCRRNPFWL